VKRNLAGIEDEAQAARQRAPVQPAGPAGMMLPKLGDRSAVAQETPGAAPKILGR